MSHSDFKGQTITITGASGFIAHAIFNALKDIECNIHLVSRTDIEQQIPNCKAVVTRSATDLSTDSAWDPIVEDSDIIFHLSSLTDLYLAEEDPKLAEKSNIDPIASLIRSLQKKPKKKMRFVFASVATIIGLNEKNPVDESFEDHPISVYDIQKKQAEDMLRSATQQGLMESCSLRLANVYGYGVSSKNSNRGMLNFIMKKALASEVLTLYGKGNYVRDFVHIEDVIDAFCRAAVHSSTGAGDHYYIASGVGHSLSEVFHIVSKIANQYYDATSKVISVAEPDRLHKIEKRNFIGNSNLFHRLTGWRCSSSLQDHIREDMQKFNKEI